MLIKNCVARQKKGPKLSPFFFWLSCGVTSSYTLLRDRIKNSVFFYLTRTLCGRFKISDRHEDHKYHTRYRTIVTITVEMWDGGGEEIPPQGGLYIKRHIAIASDETA